MDKVLNDKSCYPQKDWRDKDVLEQEDLNGEISVWEVTINFDNSADDDAVFGTHYFRSYNEAHQHIAETLADFGDEVEDVSMELIKMQLGEYIEKEGQ